MSDEYFEKMDEKLMSSMKPLREKEVSEGMLKGFSASVERRILGEQETKKAPRLIFSPAWAPALAVMVLASLVVLRSPIMPAPVSHSASSAEHAEFKGNKEMNVEEEISALKELGAWSDEDDTLLGAQDDLTAQEP